ncbi:type VII secretion-associated serine protease [Actinoplanes ianthinogenes]|uniref:Type VII secretion-associated serine protease n=1 Tax=Actinoplanes ianthinogenes TaxID=122358 RepID=A0ABM7LUS1_9ACTN|nr:S8 family serine peptidase [Actinoplanes ianthinogenes]BCJ42921.1 type VII secretion-associated serine protease [Actinoplanes ianthinogenes]
MKLLVTIAITALLAPSHTTGIAEPQTLEFNKDAWFADYLRLDQVHELSLGSGVSIGIPDSGVHPHPDLAGNVIDGRDMVQGGDGRGQLDQTGHGTHMAGLIVGHGKPGGITGIAPAAQIIPVKIIGTTEETPPLAVAIDWLTHKGAQVINVSLSVSPSADLNKSIKTAIAADIVITASAGSTSKDSRIAFPASIPEVLAVGAVDQTGRPATFSPQGPSIDLCAPGVDLRTTGTTDDYVNVDGTSPATAIVSGAAALVRARFPGISGREVVHRLTATATDIGAPGWDEQCGYGVLNIVKALTADVPPLEGGPGVGTSAGGTSGGVGVTSGSQPGSSGGQDRGDGRNIGLLGGLRPS